MSADTVPTDAQDRQSGHCGHLPGRQRTTSVLVIMLLTAHAGLLACSAWRHSPTLNEPAHLVAGLGIWEFQRFELYRVNPPLVKLIAALPVMAVGYTGDWDGFYEQPGARPVFAMGADFIAANGERSRFLFAIARWACIPISLTGGIFCYLWSCEIWNSRIAGLISLGLWCFDPGILAHGELITPDCGATAFGLGAGYMFWRWLREPGWFRAAAAGVLLGVAQLAKMTWIVLFGLWPVLWLFWLVAGGRAVSRGLQLSECRCRAVVQFLQLATVLAVGLYCLNLGYCFDGTLTRLGDYTFVSTAMTGEDEPLTPGNRFLRSPLAEMPVPLPRQYLLGMDIQKSDFEEYGQPSFLRGEWSDRGWWYYYLYGLAVKMPHGTQLVLCVSLIAVYVQCSGRGPSPGAHASVGWTDVVVTVTPALLVLILVSSQLEFNRHVRYVLPAMGFVFVTAGAGSIWFTRRSDSGQNCNREQRRASRLPVS